MTERRMIQQSPNRNENKLKAVAGLLQGLSYTEMLKLVNMIHSEMQMDPGKPATNIANALLGVSEKILIEKEVA